MKIAPHEVVGQSLVGAEHAIRRQGGTPELLAFAQLPEAPGQALLAVASDSSPADRLIKITPGEARQNGGLGPGRAISRTANRCRVPCGTGHRIKPGTIPTAFTS